MDKEFYMKRALKLAKKALGRTSPNPMVGAVIVKNGQIVGEGYHRRAGLPHAEVEALRAAGPKAKGADLYVTLEPCNHFGRTPPCTHAILKAGIKRVFIGMLDPNPHVEGGGAEFLRQNGLYVETGILEEKCRRLNEVFIKYVTTNLPFVSLKVASSLDGKIALKTGDSKWITNEQARRFVHRLRDIHDGILVGINTVLQDNPSLTTRLPHKKGKDPARIILDTHLKIPLTAKVLHLQSAAPTILICSTKAPNDKKQQLRQLPNVKILEIPTNNHYLPLKEVLSQLAQLSICSLLVEGGSQVITSFLREKLVDKVYCFYAPKIFGSPHLSMVQDLGINAMKEIIVLKDVAFRRFQDNILISGYPQYA